ncbi:MAG: DUF2062 domain-containing protein [Victivallales bacterium]|jgi:uncharacterized protein (DUF2062 family)|nr:DUF2062 domain-containing protein [Victivallales bacterium]
MALNLKRKWIYFYGKIVRAEGTPVYIARGWALGMFIGCVIPMSIQLMISIPLSFLLRCSKIGATLGTFITNPASVLFIYPAQCWIGNKIIGGDLTWEATKQATRDLIKLDVSGFMELGGDLVASFFTGGFLFALICTPVTYFGVYYLVLRYRRIKAALKAKHS